MRYFTQVNNQRTLTNISTTLVALASVCNTVTVPVAWPSPRGRDKSSARPRHFFRGTHKVRNNFGSIFNYTF